MSRIYTGTVLTAMLAASVAGLVPSGARATLISIGDSTTASGPVTTVATDGGTGFAAYAGSVGNFVLTSATGAGYPILPQPQLDTSSLDVSSTAAGTLYMYITETGLTSPLGINSFLSSFTVNQFSGGIASVTEETFISTANALYSGSLLSSQKFTATGASMAFATSPSLGPVFSETVEYIIKATGFGSTNDTVNLTLPVPEPATFGIFGVGLVAMALLARRRHSF